MVKTQVQIPDALFRKAKRLAAENGMRFDAEAGRRGLEEIIHHHPPGRTRAENWAVNPVYDLGEALALEDEWTAMCHESR